MLGQIPYAVGLVFVFVYSSCASHPVDVVFYRVAGHSFSWSERRVIQAIADDAATEAQRLLPSLPDSLILRAYLGREVLDDTGETATHSASRVVSWTVDPTRPEGVAAIAQARLRPSLFFHYYGLARGGRFPPARDFLEDVVAFGLATAFARDFSGGPVAWAAYPPETVTWVDEVLALPDDVAYNDWMGRHSDGRRRVGPSVGTYLADQAVARSGRSSADLVAVPVHDIVDLALAARG